MRCNSPLSSLCRPPLPADNIRMRRAGPLLALAPILAAVALSACGGDKAPSATTDGSIGSPPAAAVDPTATPEPNEFQQAMAQVAKSPPSQGSSSPLGAQPDRAKARALAKLLEANGWNMQGVAVYVWPVSGTKESLLIVNIDETQGAAPPPDPGPGFDALLKAPEIKQANVSRMVFVYRGRDEQGAYSATVTMPISAIQDAESLEKLTSEEQMRLLQFEIKRTGQ